MRSLRLKLAKALAWMFWKLHIITEKDYVWFCIDLLAQDAGLRVVNVSLYSAKPKGDGA